MGEKSAYWQYGWPTGRPPLKNEAAKEADKAADDDHTAEDEPPTPASKGKQATNPSLITDAHSEPAASTSFKKRNLSPKPLGTMKRQRAEPPTSAAMEDRLEDLEFTLKNVQAYAEAVNENQSIIQSTEIPTNGS
ncbi:hypothetical protein W97_06149 [Coniosporium apollinis CBS 100218]|uniref:Uncharacterized protein n=1 Tax=Coniosporium apollinis (strain CBS 100218) TaxID=1168221 RepID=R7YYQ5_CONA1|nr:uncharacterized protein W97_06149 [Coniosporium apollinis CBS 100218]EON67032.1 hypothetical protein W97_06149 [Coniosporium apollinis CBS 100218]